MLQAGVEAAAAEAAVTVIVAEVAVAAAML